MADIFEIAGRIHSTSQEHVTSPADEILDTSQNKKQHLINADVAKHESEINSPTNGLNKRVEDIEALGQIGDTPVETNASNIINNTSLNGKVPSASAVNGVYNAVVANAGYYTCDSEASTAAKVVDASGYILTVGGCIKIKMTNANTADDATLNINSTGAKALYYEGERASANNSWEEGETVEVYYDGTNFYANNVAGGSGSGDGAFDVSAKYPTSGVEGGNTYTLEGALAVLNVNLSARKKKGGMSIKFIQSSNNKYVQFRLMKNTWSIDVSDWQGVDDEPTVGSDNLVKSGGVYKKLGTPITVSIRKDVLWNGNSGMDNPAPGRYSSEKVQYYDGISFVTDGIISQYLYWSGSTFLGNSAGEISAPDGTTHIACNYKVSSTPTYLKCVGGISKELEDIHKQIEAVQQSDIEQEQKICAVSDVVTPFLIKKEYQVDGTIRNSKSTSASLLIPAVYNDVIALFDGSSSLYRVNMFDSNKGSLGQGGFTGGTSFTVNAENCAYVGITINTVDIVNKTPTINGVIITSYYANFLQQLENSIKNIDSIESDISSIESDISSIESDISSIENDIDSIGYFRLFVNNPSIGNIREKVKEAVRELYIKPEYYIEDNVYLASVRKLQDLNGTIYNIINIDTIKDGDRISYSWSNHSADYDFGNGLQLLPLKQNNVTTVGYILIDWDKIDNGTGYGSHSDLDSDKITDDVTNLNRFPIINTLLSTPEDCITQQQLSQALNNYATVSELNNLSTSIQNDYAAKSTTETVLSSHTSNINDITDEQDNINDRLDVINSILSNLTSALPDGSVSGDNNWLGHNTFAQPIIGVPATNDNELTTYGQIKNALHKNVDVADFGADPSKTASENTIAINNALLGGNKTVTITKPGIYLLNDTLLLDDNTEFICSKGVVLKKSSAYIYVIRNRGGATRSENTNIVLRGIYIDCDNKYGNSLTLASPLYGLKGQISFFHANNIKMYDITIINASVYAIQLCTFSNVLIDGFYIITQGDGVHVNRGEKLVCRNGIISSYDDACPLNASDWIGSCPEVGSIHDCVFENIVELNREQRTGNFARHLVGKWVDWYDGMNIVQGDKVVSNGHVYRAYTNHSPNTFVSRTEPNCDAVTGIQSDAGGFTWRLCNEDAVYEADIYNIIYRNIVSHLQRNFINSYYETGGVYSDMIWDRSLYPDVPTDEYPYIKNIIIEGISVLGTVLNISSYIKYEYTIRNAKCLYYLVMASNTDYGYLIIDSCTFENIQYIDVKSGAIVYLMNCVGVPKLIRMESKLISNSNVSALPSANIKGSRCMYNDELYYNDGTEWVLK